MINTRIVTSIHVQPKRKINFEFDRQSIVYLQSNISAVEMQVLQATQAGHLKIDIFTSLLRSRYSLLTVNCHYEAAEEIKKSPILNRIE